MKVYLFERADSSGAVRMRAVICAEPGDTAQQISEAGESVKTYLDDGGTVLAIRTPGATVAML